MTDKPTAVIIDLDGTLVDTSGILHYVTQRPKDYHGFHMASADCPILPLGTDFLYNAIDDGHRIIFLTGRQNRYRDLTIAWLNNHVPNALAHVDHLAMRDNGDHQPAPDFKRDAYNQITDHYTVVGAIDDDPRVIDLWNDLGIPNVVQVPRADGDNDRAAQAIDTANQRA